MKNSLVSVVIPVYNVEEYVGRCINSIIAQTYNNLEIILVDDGSTDSSGAICDMYVKSDRRIKVIHKENGGLSDARNAGLKAMKGELVAFVDSDDYVEKNYIAYMLDLLMKYNADISCCGFIETKKDINRWKKNFKTPVCVYNREEAVEDLLYQKKISTSACGKLYKRELFEGIFYPHGKLFEDIITTFMLIERTNIVVVGNQIKYGYFRRKTGIVRRDFSIHKMDYIYNTLEILNYTKENMPDMYKAALSRYIWANIYVLLQINDKLKYKEEYSLIKDTIKKYKKEILRDPKVRMKNKILTLMIVRYENIVRLIYRAKNRG